MTGYDPESLNEAEEEAEPPEGTAEITDIQETVASEVYGDEVDFDYDPTRVMIDVTAETEEGNEISDTFALPESEGSWYNPNFKLKQFKEQYGTVPEEGMEVETSLNEESGFTEIDY